MRRERGSVTVFFTMILIPTIIIVSVFTDLARIFLYSNQALLAADNMAEGQLTEYDNRLKELYGLFAVSQDSSDQLKNLEEYTKASFDIKNSIIRTEHFQSLISNRVEDFEGFIPYQSADLTLTYEQAKDANLGNPYVLGSQITNFMKFRIVNELQKNAGDIIDTIEKLKNLKSDLEVCKDKQELDDKIMGVLSKIKDYYEKLEKLSTYCDNTEARKFEKFKFEKFYVNKLNNLYNGAGGAEKKKEALIGSTEYLEFLKTSLEIKKKEKEIEDKQEEIKIINERITVIAANKAASETGKEESEAKEDPAITKLNEEIEKIEKKITEIEEEITELKESEAYKKKEKLMSDFEEFVAAYRDFYNGGNSNEKYPVTFSNFETMVEGKTVEAQGVGYRNTQERVKGLKDLTEDIEKGIEEVSGLLTSLESKLEDEKSDVSDELKENIGAELDQYRELIDEEKIANYRGIYEEFSKNIELNKIFYNSAAKTKIYLEQAKKYYFEILPEDIEPEKSDSITEAFHNDYEKAMNDVGVGTNVSHKSSRDIFKTDASGNPKKKTYGGIDSEISKFKDFRKDEKLKKHYEELVKTFKNENDKNTDNDLEKMKKEMEKKKKEIKEKEEKEEGGEGVRDLNIPNHFNMGQDKKFSLGGLNVLGAIQDLLGGDAIDTLVTKIYTIYYVFGMFTNRIDAYEVSKEEGKIFESMTGHIKNETNYLFGSEMEYVLGYYNKSKSNLSMVKSIISTFRALMNFASSYAIKEVNSSINAASQAASAMPLLAIGIQIACRGGFTAVESYRDWNRLKKGEKVPLFKNKAQDLEPSEEEIKEGLDSNSDFASSLNTATEKFKNNNSSVSLDKTPKTPRKMSGKKLDGKAGGIEVDYRQYLTILMLVFLNAEDLVKRTGNLICLNVNKINQGLDNNTELSVKSFEMEKASTAIKAQSEIGMKFLMLPDGFGKGADGNYEDLSDFTRATVGKGTYLKMKGLEGEKYKWSIIRGY